MHPPTHLAISWLISHRLPELRDRRLVAWSGVAADLDGLTFACHCRMVPSCSDVRDEASVPEVTLFCESRLG